MSKILAICLLLIATPALADHHGWGGGWHGGGWGGHWGGGGGSFGNGFWGGVVGSIIGSAVVAPPPVVVEPAPVVVVPQLQPWTPAWYTYCGQKYQSFDPRTGYYVGYDGQRYFCS